jgi:PAS domain S-box-containing protein
MAKKPTYEELEHRVQELEHLKQIEHDRLLGLLESIPYGVYIIDQQYNIQYVNPVIKKEFGYINGRKCYDYLYDRTEPCPWCKNDIVFAGKSMEWDRYSHKNDRYYDLFDMPFKNPDGSISKIQIFNDISELKRTQKVLKTKISDAEIRARQLHCLLDISRIFERYNTSLKEIHQGVVECILKALQYPDITCARLTLENKEVVSRNFKETPWQISSTVSVYGTSYGQLIVGYLEERPAEDAVPFLAEEKELIDAVTKRLGKVLERRLVEDQLLESERRFRNLVENTPTAICIIQDGNVVYRNPANTKLTGASENSIVFVDEDNVFPDDAEMVTCNMNRLFSREENQIAMDFRFYPVTDSPNKNKIKWVSCIANLIEYRGKDSYIVYLHDLTHVKKLEDLLKFQDKLASLGRVAAGIAHEIRNPLSGINIYLKTLGKILHADKNLGNDDKVNKILSQVESASNKIESVIKRVMDFSRPGEPHFVVTDINRPVTEALSLSSVTLRKSGIQLTKNLLSDLPKCNTDPNMIEQVILNLITNAAEAMQKTETGKQIHVTSYVDNKDACICVSDSGPGIENGLYNQVFDPFFTTKSNSTGIGLSICHRIITDHGGSIEAAAGNLGGAEFLIKLPITGKE